MNEDALRPAAFPKSIDYWAGLAKVLGRHYPCHKTKTKAYQEQGDECRQKLVENDPRCCVATFVDDGAGQSAIQLTFGCQGKLQMFQAGTATITLRSKITMFADSMAANLNSYQGIITDKIASVNKLEARNAQLEKQVKTMLKEKEETEKRLYAKFLCVLNEKKRKIRELEDEAESGRTTAVSHAVVPAPSAPVNSAHGIIASRTTRCGCQGGSPVREYGGSDNDSDGDDAGRRTRRRTDGPDANVDDEDERSDIGTTSSHQGTLDTLRSTTPGLHRTATLPYAGLDTGRGTDKTLSQVPATVSKRHCESIVVCEPLSKLCLLTTCYCVSDANGSASNE